MDGMPGAAMPPVELSQAARPADAVQMVCPPGHKRGVAKLWKDDKNYGFITGEDGTDLFCHSKPNDGITLAPGKEVFYTVGTQSDGRLWALEVSGPGVLQAKTFLTVAPDGTRVWNSAPPLPLGPGHHGVVKSWSDEKGYGFILHDNGRDVFCHKKAIGYGALVVGQEVSFSVDFQQRGQQWATNCTGPGFKPGPGTSKVSSNSSSTAAATAAALSALDPYSGYGSYYPYYYGGGDQTSYAAMWAQYAAMNPEGMAALQQMTPEQLAAMQQQQQAEQMGYSPEQMAAMQQANPEQQQQQQQPAAAPQTQPPQQPASQPNSASDQDPAAYYQGQPAGGSYPTPNPSSAPQDYSAYGYGYAAPGASNGASAAPAAGQYASYQGGGHPPSNDYPSAYPPTSSGYEPPASQQQAPAPGQGKGQPYGYDHAAPAAGPTRGEAGRQAGHASDPSRRSYPTNEHAYSPY